MNKNLITLVGKVSQVVPFFGVICQRYGNLTLRDLARHHYKKSYWILWNEPREVQDGN